MNNASQSSPANQENGISFPEIATMLLRRKLTVLAFAGAALLLAAIYCFQGAPTYESSTKIQIDNRFGSLTPLGQLFDFGVVTPASAEIEVIRSHANIGELVGHVNPDGSRTGLGLSQRVDDVSTYWPSQRFFRKLTGGGSPQGSIRVWTDHQLPLDGLEIEFLEDSKVKISVRELFGHSEVFENYANGQPLTFLKNQIHISGDGIQPGRMYNFYADDFQETVRQVRDRISANETLRGSGILELRYTDSDPNRAALVLDQLAATYIKHDEEMLRRPSTVSRQFIEKEKDSVQNKLAAAEKQLVEFQSQHIGSTILSETALVLVQRLAQLDLDLVQKEYAYGAAQKAFGDWKEGKLSIEEALITSAHNPFTSTFNPTTRKYEQIAADSDPIAVQLISELAELQATQANLQLEHSAEWMGLQEFEQRIARVTSKMEVKLHSGIARLSNEKEALQVQVLDDQEELKTFPAIERTLAGLQRETLALEEIYALLLARLQDATIAEKAAVSAVAIVDPALAAIKPILPRPVFFSVIGAMLGALLGVIFVIAREAAVKPILRVGQLEAISGLPQVAVIPDFRKGRARSKNAGGKEAKSQPFLALRDAPNSPAAEAYRSLRSHLSFLGDGKSLKTICITSAGKNEGKSTTIADLAIALAQTGKSVLLIDSDLRQPALHGFFDVPVKGGLSEVLLGELEEEQAIRKTDIANLSVISAGKAVESPGELLAGDKVAELIQRLSGNYDHVLVDVPPLLAVADAGSFLHKLDAVFLLCRSDHLPEKVAVAARQRLAMLNAPALGCILNAVRPARNSGYGDGFAYGESRYANREA